MLIEHIAFNVVDPVAQARWYNEHLGLRTVRSVDVAPYTKFLADSADRVVLEFYHHAKEPVPDYRSLGPLSLHIAIAAKNVPTERERLLAAGCYPAGEIKTTEIGDVMTFVRDPWGLAIQLVSRKIPLVPPPQENESLLS